ncbi:nuclease (SNase domain-containing protein) [Desulfovibrio sp. X2]|uniref:thermonuclease family protein n=1 Tax=Desulfovibrio sp. X2 TaxID=941449 RepID=UPI000358B995|nr:thermonuclease family protein [Desulfovibrio sp. X2]EPR42695.1 nuclease (SNase domain-containing protein) [Desulfovibrio sp. X2]
MRSCCLLIALVLLPAASHAADIASCMRALDGDSIIVEVQGHTLNVRLLGIDAPEHGQEWGEQAKAYTQRWCEGGPITLEYDLERTDRYHRTLAYAWRGSDFLNEDVVRSGLALSVYYSPNGKHLSRLKEAEAQAKTDRAGFWSGGGLAETPRKWRQEHRRE